MGDGRVLTNKGWKSQNMYILIFFWGFFWCSDWSGPGQGGEEEQAVKEGGVKLLCCLESILLFWSNCNLHFCIIMSSIEELKYKNYQKCRSDQRDCTKKEVKWIANWLSSNTVRLLGSAKQRFWFEAEYNVYHFQIVSLCPWYWSSKLSIICAHSEMRGCKESEVDF